MYPGSLASWMCAALLLLAAPVVGAQAVDTPEDPGEQGTDAQVVDDPDRGTHPGTVNTSAAEDALGTATRADRSIADGHAVPTVGGSGPSGLGLASGSGTASSSGPSATSSGIVASVQAEVLDVPGWAVGLGASLVGLAATVRLRARSQDPSATSARSSREGPSADASGEGPGVRFEPVAQRDERRAVEHPGASGAMLLGRQAMREDRPELASGWFATATRLEPCLAVAHLCLGLALRRAGRSEEAVAALSQAVELDATDARARLNLARALVETGSASDAIEVLAPLAGADPTIDERLAQDPAFAALGDHPRFLALLGQL